MSGPSTIWLVAGPDGVGKTTYAFRHIRAVSGSVRFVNLDEIARGLSPMDTDAGRSTPSASRSSGSTPCCGPTAARASRSR